MGAIKGKKDWGNLFCVVGALAKELFCKLKVVPSLRKKRVSGNDFVQLTGGKAALKREESGEKEEKSSAPFSSWRGTQIISFHRLLPL